MFFNSHKNVQAISGSCRIRTYLINWPTGVGSVIQDNQFADPDPKEIFTDPQHWIPYSYIPPAIKEGCVLW